MPYRNMTLEELGRHIGMDVREIKRLAEKGRLPGQMIGGVWRFNRDALLDWLQRELHSLDWEQIRNLERAMSDVQDQSVVGALLPTEAIDMNLPARSKASVLRELVALGERTGMVYDAAGLGEALAQREDLGSTALAGGLAFPHPRRPMPYATGEPLLCLARVPGGIPFGAPDGELTHVFVLLCSHDERQHLQALARLAQIFSAGLADQLRQIDDATEALELVLRTEQEVLARRR
jgi:nitrogen PTS system EIIA component